MDGQAVESLAKSLSDALSNQKDKYYTEATKASELFKEFLGDPSKHGEYSVDMGKLGVIYYRVEQRRVHYLVHHAGMQPDELKRAASLCYWIVRYKPIFWFGSNRAGAHETTGLGTHRDNNVNERFGLHVLMSAISEYRKERTLPKVNYLEERSLKLEDDTLKSRKYTKLYEDIMYYLLNRNITQEALLVLAEGIAKS